MNYLLEEQNEIFILLLLCNLILKHQIMSD